MTAGRLLDLSIGVVVFVWKPSDLDSGLFQICGDKPAAIAVAQTAYPGRGTIECRLFNHTADIRAFRTAIVHQGLCRQVDRFLELYGRHPDGPVYIDPTF